MNIETETERAMSAMKRAAEAARIRASRFGSKLAVWRNGAVILVDPDAEQAVPPKSDRADG